MLGRLVVGAGGLGYGGEAGVERPAFPLRLLWTWDHSTNWNLDTPGQVEFGCSNRYRKAPAAFLDDYGRLIDSAARARVNGIIVWGLLRDSHGGVPAAQAVIERAARQGVRILAGVGTSSYGGFVYEGDHPFNVDTWLRRHPDYAAEDRRGQTTPRLCPTHPANVEWLRQGTRWLLETLDVGGLNVENGDFVVCSCARCRAARAAFPAADPEVFKEMLFSLRPVVDEAVALRPEAWITYATYTGFVPGALPADFGGAEPQDAGDPSVPHYGREAPMLVKALPAEAIAQWTLTGMLRPEPRPLADLLDDGAGPALLDSPGWPADLRPPSRRGLGFFHQGSQWYGRRPEVDTRYSLELSSIKEACLRGAAAGLEGLAMHGEVSSRSTPYELNYLAFGHFGYRPQDSLRAFARSTLAPYLGGADLADAFVTYLAGIEADSLPAGDRRRLGEIVRERADGVARDGDLEVYRRWRWLGDLASVSAPRALARFGVG